MRGSDIGTLALLLLSIAGAVIGLLLLSSEPPDVLSPGPLQDASRPAERAAQEVAEPGGIAEKSAPRPTLSRPRVFHTCLKGRVVGLPRGLALSAWVTVDVGGEGLRAPLDADGAFVIWNLPCDRPHTLWLGFGEGKPQLAVAWDLVLRRQETRTAVLTLEGAIVVTGRVSDAKNRPLAGVRLTVVPGGANWRRPGTEILAVTDAAGRYVMIRPGGAIRRLMTVVIDGTPLGRDVVERAIRPAAGETYVCNVCLEEGLRIAGHVFGPDGKPVADAHVEFYEVYTRQPEADEPRAARGRARTDRHGYFMDDAYGPGLFRVVVWGRYGGHPFVTVREHVTAGTENLVIRFGGYGAVSLRVVNAKTGEPVAVSNGVLQFIKFVEGDDEEYEDWKDFTGKSSVLLKDVPAGRYRVCLSKIGFEPVFGDVLTVRAGRTVGPLVYEMTPRR
jgi:hypothetical protein